MERGHTLLEVAKIYGLQRNAVHEALIARGLPTSMNGAVRAYWRRYDRAIAAAFDQKAADIAQPQTVGA